MAASLAPLVAEVSDDLGLTRTQMGTVLGAWQFVYLAAAIPAGRLLDRLGLRYGLALGIAIIALSGFARAAAGGWGTLLVAVGVFGAGGPLISIGAPTLVSAWFGPSERGLATGLAVSGPVVGSMTTLLTANSVLMPAYGGRWQPVIVTYAALATALGAAFWVVTARPPASVRDPWSRPSLQRASLADLMAVPIVRLVLVMAILTFFVNHALGNWLPEILRDLGLTPAEAGFWAAIIAVPGLIAGVVVPRFATADRRRLVLVCAYGLLAVALTPLAWRWGFAAMIGVLVYGATRSIVLPLAMLFLMDDERVGPTNMASAGALYFTAGEIGGVSGPVVVGVVADRWGFAPAVGVLSAVAVVLTGLASGLRASGPVAENVSGR